MHRTQVNVQTGEQTVIELTPEEITALQVAEAERQAAIPYTEKRQAAYPPIADQLDMLYWDNVNGTNNWLSAIQSVKDQYPKPV
jgi:hypothetical protein